MKQQGRGLQDMSVDIRKEKIEFFKIIDEDKIVQPLQTHLYYQ